MRSGTLLERSHKVLINAAHDQIGHFTSPELDDINDFIFPTESNLAPRGQIAMTLR
jgi:hypothetical protein